MSASLAQAQQRPAVTGLAFVRFYVTDAAAADAFYGRTLGYVGIRDGAITRYPVNDVQWIETTPLPSPAPTSKQAAVGFMTRDAAALATYLEAHGTTLATHVKNGEFSVRDPEGNLIVFVDHTAPAAVAVKRAPLAANAPSHRLIHTGFVVQSAAKENEFYRELLDFKPYWHGGRTDDSTDYVSQQAPEGSDWLEYMLNNGTSPTPKQLGGADHISLGVDQMSTVIAALERNGCTGPNCTASKTGRDGKVQLNLFDPDLTRVEYMEFKPSGATCCSQFTAPHPTATESR